METTYPPKTETLKGYWMTDPSHAWFVTDAENIRTLEIADQISSFSYLGTGKVYLEEDCDATRFFHAANLSGFEIVQEDEKRYQADAPCRRLGRFKEYAQNYHPTQLF